MVIFKKVRWKNFLSYGNEWNELNLNDRNLTIFSGKNGAGKSVLLDALNYCLFGKPYRKIRLSELVNRTNKREMLVELLLCSNKDKIRIVRGISPQKFEIYKNKKLLNIENIVEYQKKLESIFGFDEKIFQQIVTMGSGYHIPYSKLSGPQKREINEQLFELDVLAKMKDLFKKKFKNLKKKKEEKTLLFSQQKRIISNTKQHLTKIEDHNNRLEQIREEKVGEIDNSILSEEEKLRELKNKKIELGNNNCNELINDIQIVENTIDNFMKKREEIRSKIFKKYSVEREKCDNEIEFLNEKIRKNRDEYNKLNIEKIKLEDTEEDKILKNTKKFSDKIIKLTILKEEIENQIDFYKENPNKCQTCGNSITKEYIEEKLISLEKEKIERIKLINKNKNEIKNISEEFSKKYANEFENMSKKISIIDNKNRNFHCSLKEVKNKRNILSENEKDDVDNKLDSITRKIKNNKKLLINMREKLQNSEKHKQEISNIETRIEIIKNKILDLKNSKKQLKESKIDYMNIESTRKELQNQRKELNNIKDNLKKIDKKLEYFLYIDDFFSDSGIKSIIIQKHLNFLNKKVNEYLDLFGAEFELEFTSTLDCRIKVGKTKTINYDSNSGGEKVRIDLAILFAFSSFTKMRHFSDTNLLIFDEILDSSLDREGMSALIDILNLFTINGKSIMIISHREDNFAQNFSQHIQIEKKNGFSIVKKTSI